MQVLFYNINTIFLIFLLRHPQLMECSQRRQDRPTNPCTEFAFHWMLRALNFDLDLQNEPATGGEQIATQRIRVRSSKISHLKTHEQVAFEDDP